MSQFHLTYRSEPLRAARIQCRCPIKWFYRENCPLLSPSAERWRRAKGWSPLSTAIYSRIDSRLSFRACASRRKSSLGWVFAKPPQRMLLCSSVKPLRVTGQARGHFRPSYTFHNRTSPRQSRSFSSSAPLESPTRAHKLRSLPRCSEKIPVLTLCLCARYPIDLIC